MCGRLLSQSSSNFKNDSTPIVSNPTFPSPQGPKVTKNTDGDSILCHVNSIWPSGGQNISEIGGSWQLSGQPITRSTLKCMYALTILQENLILGSNNPILSGWWTTNEWRATNEFTRVVVYTPMMENNAVIQSSAVIMRSNLSRYYIRRYDDSKKT